MAGAELRVILPTEGPGAAGMEQSIRAALRAAAVTDAVWTRDGAVVEARFSADAGDPLEDLLRRLADAGVGQRPGTALAVWPCALRLQAESGGVASSAGPAAADGLGESSAWASFLGSVGARLAVARVVQGVEMDARLTFDFLSLLLIAAFLAALGLVENSTEILVASMLISPLMGPIMAGTFGTMIGDRRLQKLGVRNELLGLAVCLLLGFLFGLTAAAVAGGWPRDWPTREMISRGELHAVWVGVLIALFSGAAVAIATLGDYTGSLVGVAISAALLPPAVNAGLLWSLACAALLPRAARLSHGAAHANGSLPPADPTAQPTPADVVSLPLQGPGDVALQGAISVCLTLLNILCIFLAGVLVLKVKQVAPRTSHQQRHFWAHDVRIARDFNRGQRAAAAEASAAAASRRLGRPRPGQRFPARTRRSSLLMPSHLSASQLAHFNEMCSECCALTWSPGCGNGGGGGGARPSLHSLYVSSLSGSGGPGFSADRSLPGTPPPSLPPLPPRPGARRSPDAASPPPPPPPPPPLATIREGQQSSRFVVTPAADDPLRRRV